MVFRADSICKNTDRSKRNRGAIPMITLNQIKIWKAHMFQNSFLIHLDIINIFQKGNCEENIMGISRGKHTESKQKIDKVKVFAL